MAPCISVIMSVYNGEIYLARAIESVLRQSYQDFEFIIVNDGSHDKTAEILSSFARADSRIKIHTQENTGLTLALNNGLALASGEFIARQDADDFSLPDRFEKQMLLMNENPDVLLCGGNSIDIFPDGSTSEWGYEDKATLSQTVFFKTPFPHSTALFRRSVLQKVKGYDPDFRTSQDAELWMHIAQHGQLAMIATPILERMVLDSSISSKKRFRQFKDALKARWRHTSGLRKFAAIYHSTRSLLINSLPQDLARKLRALKKN